jgi:hypothetical protein
VRGHATIVAISIALGGAVACRADREVTLELRLEVNRASTEIRVDGAMIDGGGAVPRTVVKRYSYVSWPDEKSAPPLVIETYGNGSKLGEVTVAVHGCADAAITESTRVIVTGDGSLALDCSTCLDADDGVVGGVCP